MAIGVVQYTYIDIKPLQSLNAPSSNVADGGILIERKFLQL